MKKWFFLCLFPCLFLAASMVRAEDEGHVRFLKYRADYQVNADATYTVVQDIAYRLLTKASLVNSGKMPIRYNGKLEEVDVLEAYTLKPDGRRIDVGTAGIQTQHGQLASGYGISQADQRTLMITFPQLEVGDMAVYKFRRQQKEAVFPGHFYASGQYSKNFFWDEIDVSIELPQEMALQTETVGMQQLPTQKHEDGRQIVRWQARKLPIVPAEGGAVDQFVSIPHFIATTFTDWRQFAQAYEARAKPKAAVTPAIASLAEAITKDIADPRAQVKAIYDWIGHNIRYVAIWAGAEGWVPHDAETVLTRRYGDCKGHVVLFEALLAAKGIASSTVMINADKTSYTLPSAVYPAFNHVITYVPAFDLYIDSTAGTTTPFGVLPVSQADKPVIHTDIALPVRRTPMLDPAQFAATRITRLSLNEEGDAEGEFVIHASGPAAISLREMQQSIGKRRESEWVRELLQGRSLEGEGSIDFEQGADGTSMTARLQVKIRNYLAVSENGVIPLMPILSGPISFDHLFGVHRRHARTLPFWCPAWTLEDRYEIRVPDSFKLTMPKSREIVEAGFSYASRYDTARNTFTVVRRLAIDSRGMACQPAVYPEKKAAVARIERAVRAQVIYQVQ